MFIFTHRYKRLQRQILMRQKITIKETLKAKFFLHRIFSQISNYVNC